MKKEIHHELTESETPLISVFCTADKSDIFFDDDRIALLLQSSGNPAGANSCFKAVRADLLQLFAAGNDFFKRLKKRKLPHSYSEVEVGILTVELSLTGASCALDLPPAMFEEMKTNQELAGLSDTIHRRYQSAADQFRQIVEGVNGTALCHEQSVIQSLLTIHSWYAEGGDKYGD